MRSLILGFILLAMSAACFGEDAPAPDAPTTPATPALTPEQAMQRLRERQAAREADRNQKVTITRGELDDLRAEVDSLKAEIAKLKADAPGQPTAPAAPVRAPQKLAVGMSREQVNAFLNAHKANAELTSDSTAGAGGEQMVIDLKSPVWVKAGKHSNGVNLIQDYSKELQSTGTLTVTLANDVVTGVTTEGKWSTSPGPLPDPTDRDSARR